MIAFPVKVGQTLLLTATAQQDDGTPIDITGATFTSEVRDLNAALVAELTVTIAVAAAGTFQLGPCDTTGWPPGNLSCDIRYALNGVILYSETFGIVALPSITAPPAAPP
jgi:hypothetical protein